MTIPQMRVLLLGFLAHLVRPALGQTSELFQWQFANSAIATSLPTCATLSIVVKSFDTVNITQGTPPYYMIAFAVGGTPQTSLIGMDENNLSWTVTQPVGSQLALSVVDANGSAGGIPPRLFQVADGQSTQCVVNPPTLPTFTVTANVTTKLTTCQPWGLTVKGGVPPYNVTLLQLNSPNVTNVTMPNGLDQFTFIDRATPGLTLIAAISDFTGRWASGTPSVEAVGSNDTACVGLVSESGNSTQIFQALKMAESNLAATKRHHSIAIGFVVGLIVLIVAGLCLAIFMYLRKRKREEELESSEAKPHQFVEIPFGGGNDQSPSTPPVSRKAAILAEIHATRSNARTSPSSSQTTLPPNVQAPPVALVRNNTSVTTIVSSSPSSGHISSPGFVTFPTTPIRRSGRLATAQPVMTITSAEPGHLETEPPNSAFEVFGEPVFQHRDGGQVTELPPPYPLGRSRRASS